MRGTASAHGSDLQGFMQRMKWNVYSFNDKLSPRLDTSQFKNTPCQVHCITNTYIHSNISQHHSLHPAYRRAAFRSAKVSDKERGEQHPSPACARRYHKHNCQCIMLLSLHHLGMEPETPRYCLSR